MTYTYLALGDSYTIGDQVMLSESFPYQAVKKLREELSQIGKFTAPEIIARTGWASDELEAAVQQTVLLKQYDIVSLLIGVNNHYQGRSVKEFEDQFSSLLECALEFAAGNHKRVFVLSIPDWGVTTFAEGRDRKKIAADIDSFNEVCKRKSLELECTYIDITTLQRANGELADHLAPDGLHPSAKEYGRWADQLVTAIIRNLFQL